MQSFQSLLDARCGTEVAIVQQVLKVALQGTFRTASGLKIRR
ncbi:MAG: hypothetical protein ACO2PP_17560 [Thermocrinis sp.]